MEQATEACKDSLGEVDHNIKILESTNANIQHNLEQSN